MEFCYLRVGRGVPVPPSTDADGIDARWATNVEAAKAAGLQVGGYWRFFPSGGLARQVTAFCDRLTAAGPLDLPAMVDIEDADGLGPVELTDWAVEVLGAVQDRMGTPPLLYTFRWFRDNAVQFDRLYPRWPLALAANTGDDTTWISEQATVWQYAQNVTVDWAAGPVDLQRRRTG